MTNLPIIRSHERIDWKRCPKKWYWKWRMGLTPKAKAFGALELGTWMHEALAMRYGTGETLEWCFSQIANAALAYEDAPDHVKEAAEQGQMLGLAMAKAYDKRYGSDPGVNVIQAEVPLEYVIADEVDKLIAIHKFKPDLVYSDDQGGVWLMEHKTAGSIRLEHLVIDDQARPYVAMAERALRQAGLLKSGQNFKGIMYNFLRKALPDERPVNEKGQSLNKNGSISKSQPTAVFVRHPITLTRAAKRIALERLQGEAMLITGIAQKLRDKLIEPQYISKTPHNSCPRFCQYFTMCVVEEQGGDIREMQRSMYTREDPYAYAEETTDIPPSFEIG